MPNRSFRLDKNNPALLDITWKLNWTHLCVSYDKKPVGEIATRQELDRGREFKLPNVSVLKVQRIKLGGIPTLEVLHNGKIVDGSDTDPQMRNRIASQVLYFIGAMNIIVGLLPKISILRLIEQYSTGIGNLLIGAFFIFLAVLVRKGSFGALLLAMTLFILDSLLSLDAYSRLHSDTTVGIIVLRIALLIPMLQAYGAKQHFKKY
ncbi:MAG: hypothetical protein Q8Q33_09720 [Chlamydiota bacterium]|nr:hypothetical protein [Chlamydiota bacterium]